MTRYSYVASQSVEDGSNAASGQLEISNAKGLLSGLRFEPKASYRAYQSLCTLFDAETRTADFLVHFAASGRKNQLWNSRDEPLGWQPLCSAAFVRNGHPVYAWWRPATLQEPFTPGEIAVLVWSGREAALARPVLIDPLTASVYALENGARSGGYLRFDSMPVIDYPLIVTDESVLEALRQPA